MVPVNLFEAEYIVVKGRFEGEEFISKNVLVKCPSKYEAQTTSQ
jgi:cytochrome c-type biogenesis protein CcmE